MITFPSVKTVYIKVGRDLLIEWLQHTNKMIFDNDSTQVPVCRTPVRRTEEDALCRGTLFLLYFCFDNFLQVGYN